MEHALAIKKTDLELDGIHEMYVRAFVNETLSAYEFYAENREFVGITMPFYFDGDQLFIDLFIELFYILRASIKEESYPEFDWDEATEEEIEELEEKINHLAVDYECGLIENIMKILDFHQLFYLTWRDAEGQEEILVPEYHQSPLQSIW